MNTDNRLAILKTAQAIVDESMDILQGCRKIAAMAEGSGSEDFDLFKIFLNVADDCETFPLEEKTRSLWNVDYLKQLDEQKKALIDDCKDDILEGCKQIIDRYK